MVITSVVILLVLGHIYVHPSRLEGKSIAVEEVRILCKPIVVTSFSTVTDQIQNEEDGIIVNLDEEGVYKGIKKLIDSINLRQNLSFNLTNKNFSNEDKVISKFNILIKE